MAERAISQVRLCFATDECINSKIRIMKNKLPRKRKKAFIKNSSRGNYLAFQIINEIAFEENGYSDFRFPKYKFIEGQGNIMIGYW